MIIIDSQILKKKIYILIYILTFSSRAVFGQSFQIEAIPATKNINFQGTFISRLSDSTKFGIFSTSSVTQWYDKSQGSEIMTQTYFTKSLNQRFNIGLGTFFAGRELKPSFTVQYIKASDSFFLLVAPRVDYWREPSYELMSLFEYKPRISSKYRLYSRLQIMTNWGKEHLRSFQYLRIGLYRDNYQFGFSGTLDQYGSEGAGFASVGFFVRKEINLKFL